MNQILAIEMRYKNKWLVLNAHYDGRYVKGMLKSYKFQFPKRTFRVSKYRRIR